MRVRIAVMALASLVLGVVSFAAARAEPGYFPGGRGAGIALLGTAAGWAATAAGLVMWRTGRSGALLALAGTAWLLAACSSPEVGSAVVFTAALAGGLAAPALIAHALRPGVAIAAIGYAFAVGIAGVGQALFFDPAVEGCGSCPDNLLLVHADDDARLELMRIGMAGTAGVLVVALLIAAARLHRVPAARRAGEAVFVLPVGAFAAAAAAQLVHGLDRGFISNDPTDRGLWLAQALALVAAAAGTAYEPLRRRRARADLARLVLELGRVGAGGLREALAARFRDPGLEIVYRTGDGAWIRPTARPRHLCRRTRRSSFPAARSWRPSGIAATRRSRSSPRARGWASSSSAYAPSRAINWRSCGRRARVSSRRATRSAGGWSATCTTARSSGSSRLH